MDAELESNVGDKGESSAHNLIVPSNEPEAIFLFSGLVSTENTELITAVRQLTEEIQLVGID